jgi:hypothetical protein
VGEDVRPRVPSLGHTLPPQTEMKEIRQAGCSVHLNEETKSSYMGRVGVPWA